jgi:hypothetical protein
MERHRAEGALPTMIVMVGGRLRFVTGALNTWAFKTELSRLTIRGRGPMDLARGVGGKKYSSMSSLRWTFSLCMGSRPFFALFE